MPSDFYHWLVLASLKASLILPMAVAAVWASRKTSSAVLTLMLGCALLFIPFAPFLDAVPNDWEIRLPFLESTKAFAGNIPELVKYDEDNPVPIRAGEIHFSDKKWLSTQRMVVFLWGFGALFFASSRLWRSLNSKLRFSSSSPAPPDDPVKKDFYALCKKRGVKRVPWLLYNTNIVGPQTIGILSPSILLPTSFRKTPRDQRSMILLHELAHIQRRDIVWRLLLEVLSIIFWFHPFVWLTVKNYDLQVEKSCDDAVLHAEYSAATYGEALLTSARGSSDGLPSKLAPPKQVDSRMFSIVHKGKSRHPLTTLATLKFSLLFLLVMIPLGMVSFTPYDKSLGYEIINGGDTLKALWRMKIGQGSIIADSSGNDRHGKIFGAQWVKDPKRGICLSFDGKNDHLILRAPDASWTNKPFSLCVWLKPAPNSDGGGLLLRGDPNQMWSSSMGANYKNYDEREIVLAGKIEPMQFHSPSKGLFPMLNFWGISAAESSKALPSNEWTHFTIIWEPSGNSAFIRIYLNGKPTSVNYLQDITRNNHYDWPASVWYFGLGESPISVHNNYEGLVSDLTIYQKALSHNEVKRVMHGDFSIKK